MKEKDNVILLFKQPTERHYQSRQSALLEAILNVSSGAILAFIITEAVASTLGIVITGTANLKLTIILTVVSVIRGYLWRRYFNRR